MMIVILRQRKDTIIMNLINLFMSSLVKSLSVSDFFI